VAGERLGKVEIETEVECLGYRVKHSVRNRLTIVQLQSTFVNW
jgi:hypothetical protein